MILRRVSMFLAAAAAAVVTTRAQAPPIYKDASRPVADRVADLLGRMTIEEKVAQLEGVWQRRADFQDAAGRFNPAAAAARLGNGLGELSRPRSRYSRRHCESLRRSSVGRVAYRTRTQSSSDSVNPSALS